MGTRTTPLVGTKVWFGPRRWLGWGWTPVSWEGWVAIAVMSGLAAGLGAVHLAPLVLVVIAALLVVCSLKGTTPGGPAAWRAFRGEPAGPAPHAAPETPIEDLADRFEHLHGQHGEAEPPNG